MGPRYRSPGPTPQSFPACQTERVPPRRGEREGENETLRWDRGGLWLPHVYLVLGVFVGLDPGGAGWDQSTGIVFGAGVVARQVGHARPDFTRGVYQRARRSDARAAADAIDRALGTTFATPSVDSGVDRD
jgi:hypothetical protein